MVGREEKSRQALCHHKNLWKQISRQKVMGPEETNGHEKKNVPQKLLENGLQKKIGQKILRKKMGKKIFLLEIQQKMVMISKTSNISNSYK